MGGFFSRQSEDAPNIDTYVFDDTLRALIENGCVQFYSDVEMKEAKVQIDFEKRPIELRYVGCCFSGCAPIWLPLPHCI